MIKLSDYSTRPPKGLDKKEAIKEIRKNAKRIGELHNLLMAEGKRSVLIILQGMDASGKDGAVRKVFGECVHNNFNVHSFKKPTEEEFAHDFLWRVHKICPAKGEITVFNRSHYEDVLVQRVHGWIDEETVDRRFESINAFEKLLQYDANTLVLKFYLHLSYEQQEIELQQRIDEKEKNWKHNDGDWKEREHWKEYMRCYHDVLNRAELPWHIVPVDARWYRDLVMSRVIVKEMEALNMEYPLIEV